MLERSSASLNKIWKQALFVLAALATLGVLLYSLTTAWYSNVAETTPLVFETESWGFEGQVKTLNAELLLAPGQDACAELSVTNDGQQINRITVSVDKTAMSPELQKRIYFYVPALQEQNGETAERVYLSTYGGYSYRVMPKSTLLLTADSAAEAPVRCQWVYDLLGYYVYGTLDKDHKLLTGEQLIAAKRTDVPAPDYIRPVEYDYDRATFQDGKLLTTDGTTTADSFVAQLLAKDGYKGSDLTKYGDYYAVSVTGTANGEATGLWLYLCTQQEIEEATAFDTRVGTYRYLLTAKNEDGTPALTEERQKEYADVAALSYAATIRIAGQNLRTDTADVTTPQQLSEVLASGGSVRISQDMTVDSVVTVPAGKDVVIDLNGKRLSTTLVGEPVLYGAPGSSVTVLNGTIDGGSRETTVQLEGSSASFSGVTIRGRLRIDDTAEGNTDGVNSVVRLINCTVQTPGREQVGVHVFGNGAASSSRTVLLVENSTIESTYAGIVGNGSDPYYGTDIQVINSTVTGTYAGIYQPQRDSRLLVRGSTVTGMTGIVLKGGTATVSDSTVSGTAADGFRPTSQQLAASRSGWLDTGAGVYVEANYAWAEQIALTVTDETTITVATDSLPMILLAGDTETVETIRKNSDFTGAGNISIGT